MRKMQSLVLAVSLSTLTSCGMERVHVRVMRPAPVDLGRYDVLAVDRFEGQGGDLLASDFGEALRNAVNPLTGRADYTVVDRREVDRMLDEMRGRPGKVDQQIDDLLQQWRNAQVVVHGNVYDYEFVEKVVEHPFVDDQGHRHVNYSRQASATVGVNIEATDTNGDKLFDSVRFDEAVSATTQAVDEEPALIDPNELIAAARQRVVARYMKRVMPHEDYVSVHLYSDGDLPQLQIGNGFAKTGDWDEALRSYEEATGLAIGEKAELRYMALFNAGVALEYTNRFAEARESLKQAYAMGQDDVILRELQNVSYREQEYQRLMEQGRQGQPAQPNR